MIISKKLFSLNSGENELNSSHLFISQLLRTFCEQGTSGSLMGGIVCGNLLGSITKNYTIRILSPLFQENISLIRRFSTVAGCFMEGGGVQLISSVLKGEAIGEEGFRGWVHMSLTMTMIKAIGCARISNPLLQHVVQDFAMVELDNLCGVIGLIESTSRTFAEGMIQVETVSLQMRFSANLVNCMFLEMRLITGKQELQSNSTQSSFFSIIKKTFLNFSTSIEISPPLAPVDPIGLKYRLKMASHESVISKSQQLFTIAYKPSGSVRVSSPPRRESPSRELQSSENSRKSELLQKPILTLEYTSYLTAWQRVVNPSFRQMSMMNNAGGPDRLTGSLLGGRVRQCFVVELSPISVRKLKFYHSNWEQLDQTPFLPIPESWKEAQPDSLSNYARIKVRERFLQEMNLRSEKGYWNVREINQWGIERCILIELKRMGINPATIHIASQKKGFVELQYEWGTEGKDPEETHVVYLEGAFPELMAQGKLPKVDIFYQKAVSENMDAETVHYLPNFINPGGVVILGKVQKGLVEQQIREALNRRRLGKNFSKVDVPWAYTLAMHEFIERYVEKQRIIEEGTTDTVEEVIERSNYWWQLYGAKRID